MFERIIEASGDWTPPGGWGESIEDLVLAKANTGTPLSSGELSYVQSVALQDPWPTGSIEGNVWYPAPSGVTDHDYYMIGYNVYWTMSTKTEPSGIVTRGGTFTEDGLLFRRDPNQALRYEQIDDFNFWVIEPASGVFIDAASAQTSDETVALYFEGYPQRLDSVIINPQPTGVISTFKVHHEDPGPGDYFFVVKGITSPRGYTYRDLTIRFTI